MNDKLGYRTDCGGDIRSTISESHRGDTALRAVRIRQHDSARLQEQALDLLYRNVAVIDFKVSGYRHLLAVSFQIRSAPSHNCRYAHASFIEQSDGLDKVPQPLVLIDAPKEQNASAGGYVWL